MIESPPVTESPAEEQVDHSSLTWSRAIGILVIVQFVFIVGISLYFTWVANQQKSTFAAEALAQARANHAIIEEVNTDLDIHAHASADRTCGVAHLLDYLARSSPLPRSTRELGHITELVKQACKVVPIGETTG